MRIKRSSLPVWQRMFLISGVTLGLLLIGLSGGVYYARSIHQSFTAGATLRHSATPVSTGDTPTAAPVLSSSLTSCQMLPQQSRMLTSQQIDHPLSPGRLLQPTGHAVGCSVSRLWVPQPNGGAPDWPGQVIVVSVTQQWLWAYQDGKLVFATPVTTGMPWLWTPLGVYHITTKVEDTVFYSPWPPSSPFYYTPEHVDYALFFRQKGFYIHDAPWRQAFGPGTEVPHTDPDGTYETGSHGCVNVTYGAGQWLYNWTSLGAAVDIVAN